MDALSNADRFVFLLRQKLAERSSSKRGAATKGATAANRAANALHRPIAQIAAQSGADDRTLRRTIVEQLMTDRLGAGLTNEPRFQQLIEQVTAIIAADPELGAILEEVMVEVRR